MTKKIEKKPVFEILDENKICFAVCVASSRFINREVTAFSKDYFIIINKCDEDRVKELTFYPTEGYKQVCQRSLSEDEINVFRENKDKFIKTIHNNNGKVFELTRWSFRSIYDSIRQKLDCKLTQKS